MALRKIPVFQGSDSNVEVTAQFLLELKKALLLSLQECELLDREQLYLAMKMLEKECI